MIPGYLLNLKFYRKCQRLDLWLWFVFAVINDSCCRKLVHLYPWLISFLQILWTLIPLICWYDIDFWLQFLSQWHQCNEPLLWCLIYGVFDSFFICFGLSTFFVNIKQRTRLTYWRPLIWLVFNHSRQMFLNNDSPWLKIAFIIKQMCPIHCW